MNFKPGFTRTAKLGAAALILCMLCFTTVGCTQSDLQEASNIVNVVVPAVTSVIQLVQAFGGSSISSSDVNTATSILQQVQSDFTTADTLLQGYTSANATTTVQKINAALSDADTNLAAILPALHVTNTATVAKVTALVNLIDGEVQAFEGLIPAAGNTAYRGQRGLRTTMLKAKDFKTAFNATLKAPSGNALVDSVTVGIPLLK